MYPSPASIAPHRPITRVRGQRPHPPVLIGDPAAPTRTNPGPPFEIIPTNPNHPKQTLVQQWFTEASPARHPNLSQPGTMRDQPGPTLKKLPTNTNIPLHKTLSVKGL